MRFVAWTLFFAALNYVTPILSQSLDLSDVVLSSVTYGGSGCPQGTLNYTFINADTFIATTNVTFSASVGPKANSTDSYVFCQTLLDIQYPLGIQYSPVATSYYGAVDLELGADGVLETSYYYSGCSAIGQLDTETTFTGPVKERYNVTNPLAGFWSDCTGRNLLPLNVVHEIEVGSGTSNASGTLWASGVFVTTLEWRSCNSTAPYSGCF